MSTLSTHTPIRNQQAMQPGKRLCAATFVVVAWWAASAQAQSQVSVLGPEQPLPTVPQQDFLSIQGERAVVAFLPGGLDRAHHLLRRLDNLGASFRRWRKDLVVPLAAYVVDREQWGKIELPGLYGLPLRTGPTSIFVPANGDGEAIRMWRSALGVGTLPMVPGVPVTGSPEEAAVLALSDVLTQFEASRGFVIGAGLVGQDGWMQEVAAHTAALVVFDQTEPQRRAEIVDLFRRLRERMGGKRRHDDRHFTHGLLNGGEEEVQAWLWYQGVFFEAANILVTKDGKRAVPRLLKMAQKGGGLQRAQLFERYVGLPAWHQNWFAEPGDDPLDSVSNRSRGSQASQGSLNE